MSRAWRLGAQPAPSVDANPTGMLVQLPAGPNGEEIQLRAAERSQPFHVAFVESVTEWRDSLTEQIRLHAEDAAMWIAPESNGWALLTVAQRVQLTRDELAEIDRLLRLREHAERVLATVTRHIPAPPTETVTDDQSPRK